MPKAQKITTFLWFDKEAEEAVAFYRSIFKDSKVLDVMRWGDVGPGPKGSVLAITFQLEGQRFVAMNGGPGHPFTEAISLMVDCATQAEVDSLWKKLLAGGGKESMCGWLVDKYGLSWQVTPTMLMKALSQPDVAKASRAMEAMMQMRKIDIAKIEAAVAARPRDAAVKPSAAGGARGGAARGAKGRAKGRRRSQSA